MILDHISKYDFPDDRAAKYGNELQSLRNLWQGLTLIYLNASSLEKKAKEQFENGSFLKSMPADVRKDFEGKGIRYFSAGNDPLLEWLNKGILYSLFQWYAVSACNYVRLIGWLGREADQTRPKSVDYIESIIPKVKWFRDKIAAHPVRTSMNKEDNEADRIASVFYQVGFDSGRFYAPVWQIRIGKNDKVIKSSNAGPWSITETHEELIERYNPSIANG